MNTKTFVITLLFPVLTFSQIGIGTTNVDPSAILQIESTEKGFLQPRITLTGTDDVATIASPARGLMIFNTASAGTGETEVTPGLYYYTGSIWQRLADQQVSTKSNTTTFVSGNLGSPYAGGNYWMAGGSSSTKTSGAFITLPPGRWEVNLNITCLMTQYDSNWGYPMSLQMSYWLTDSSSSTALNYNYPTTPNDITADILFPGGGLFSEPIAGAGNLGSEHSGSFYINNTTSNDKTYYLFFHEGGIAQTDNIDGFEPYYSDLGGSTWKGNRFYATKID